MYNGINNTNQTPAFNAQTGYYYPMYFPPNMGIQSQGMQQQPFVPLNFPNSVNTMGSSNSSNQISSSNQNQKGGSTNPMNKMNTMNSMNSVNPANPVNPVNPMNPMNPVNPQAFMNQFAQLMSMMKKPQERKQIHPVSFPPSSHSHSLGHRRSNTPSSRRLYLQSM